MDDHPIVRSGLRRDLEADNVEVIGEAGSAAEARDVILELKPDVAIVDLRLPDGSGVEVVRYVRSQNPHIACIVFTSFSEDDAFFQAVVAGAAGFLLKDAAPETVLDHVRRAAAGESLIRPELLDELRARPAEVPDNVLFSNLSPQERRILGLVTSGATNREIAENLSLAEKTVRNYVSNILGKVGMKNRTQLAAAVARMRSPR